MKDSGLKNIFEAQWKGLLPYESAWQLQQQVVDRRCRDEVFDQILGLEHPHVITLGKRSKFDPEIPEGPTVWVDRGGEATLHSEGQLVIYPLVKLKPRFEVRSWVEHLHLVTEKSLGRVGVSVHRGDNSGLWSSGGKITFMGLRIKSGVSMHGISINVCNDLGLFSSMKACGVRGAELDSLQKHGLKVTPEELFSIWIEEFKVL